MQQNNIVDVNLKNMTEQLHLPQYIMMYYDIKIFMRLSREDEISSHLLWVIVRDNLFGSGQAPLNILHYLEALREFIDGSRVQTVSTTVLMA